MPCPGGVDIPRTFAAWNESSLYDLSSKDNRIYQMIKKDDMTPEKCLQCGACEAACPQHLNIIESLQIAWKEMESK